MNFETEAPNKRRSKKRRAGRKVQEKKRSLENAVHQSGLWESGQEAATGSTPLPSPLFELHNAGHKNLGLFAVQEIKSGTRIIEEDPLMLVEIGDAMDQFILDEFDCLTEAGKKAFLELGTYKQTTADTGDAPAKVNCDTRGKYSNEDVETSHVAYAPLTTIRTPTDGVGSSNSPKLTIGNGVLSTDVIDDREIELGIEEFRIHHDAGAADRHSPLQGTAEQTTPLQGPTTTPKPVDCDALDAPIDPSHIVRVYRTNAFGLETDSSMISGICPAGARINHSCTPNVFCTFNTNLKKHTVHAIRDIGVDEELFTSYIPGSFLLRAERLESLAKWGFVCACTACEDSEGGQESEKRRTRMKGLDEEASEAKARFTDLSLEEAAHTADVLEELAGLMVEEGLLSPDLANV